MKKKLRPSIYLKARTMIKGGVFNLACYALNSLGATPEEFKFFAKTSKPRGIDKNGVWFYCTSERLAALSKAAKLASIENRKFKNG